MQEIVQQLFGGYENAASYELLRKIFVDWQIYVLLVLSLIHTITVHEFGHAWMAHKLGDPTPKEQGRVTLNPFAHLDLLGTLLILASSLVGMPIGWGKPVQTDPDSYKVGPRLGKGLVAAAGPLMNLITAVAMAPIARWFLAGHGRDYPWTVWVFAYVILAILVNISLFCFNLLPIHPLDGSHITASLLPEKLSAFYQKFMVRYGTYIFLALMASGTLSKYLGPIVITLFKWLVGIR